MEDKEDKETVGCRLRRRAVVVVARGWSWWSWWFRRRGTNMKLVSVLEHRVPAALPPTTITRLARVALLVRRPFSDHSLVYLMATL